MAVKKIQGVLPYLYGFVIRLLPQREGVEVGEAGRVPVGEPVPEGGG